MKKLSVKSATKSLKSAVIDGAVIYGGRTGYRVINAQLSKLIGNSIPAQFHGAVMAAAGIVAADLLLPAGYARLAGAAMASEVIEDFVAPTLDPMLASTGLLPAGAPAAGYGRVTRGYGRVVSGMGGYTSVRSAPATSLGFTH